jgi:outer membrane protein assembly factor BamA
MSLNSDVDGITNSDTNQDNLPSAAVFLGLDTRDKPSDARLGWLNEIDVMKTVGDGNFWTFNVDIQRYQAFTQRHGLALFSLATFQTGRVGEEIPIYRDFHLGGTNTVRGWRLDSRNGKHQFINTIEYRYALMKPRPLSISSFTVHLGLQLAVFGDLGLAWNESDEFDLDNFIDGYGFGLRLLVPFVQMVRFDVGFGEPGRGMTVHIALFEKAVMQRARVR